MSLCFDVKDILGQTATLDFSVKVYAAPEVVINPNIKTIKENDRITPALFGASAKDRFGEKLECDIRILDGVQNAGGTMTFVIGATDASGQTTRRSVTALKYTARRKSPVTRINSIMWISESTIFGRDHCGGFFR